MISKIENAPKVYADFVNSDITGVSSHYVVINGKRFWADDAAAIAAEINKLLADKQEALVGELQIALRESLKLQAHYAELLNMHNGGSRMVFRTPEEWMARLRKTGTIA